MASNPAPAWTTTSAIDSGRTPYAMRRGAANATDENWGLLWDDIADTASRYLENALCSALRVAFGVRLADNI